ncbi:MAG: dTMP kinase [Aureliella sp.]
MGIAFMGIAFMGIAVIGIVLGTWIPGAVVRLEDVHNPASHKSGLSGQEQVFPGDCPLRGKMISIDGIDGCGKSTQIERLQSWIERAHGTVQVVRDPGGTQLGESLREILLHKKEIALDVRAEMLMYMASRAQLVHERVRPWLEEGIHVVSDRYLLANVVYQGYGGGLNPSEIWSVGAIATGGLKPDLTILLDLPAEIAAKRVGKEMDRLESRGLEYMSRVREGFVHEASSYAGSLVKLDATNSIEWIHEQIREHAQKLWE